MGAPLARLPGSPYRRAMNAEDFERVLEEGRELQAYLPELELVAAGGTAAAVHCRHRFSQDVDCVTPVLRGRFAEVAESLDRSFYGSPQA